mmetsp:Transcript_88273/g.140367  ORF Transcript_88273/g.140367 Transcript_88273/m.140367 type:complete len:269 (-) Transcript_88273:557-1363(-)
MFQLGSSSESTRSAHFFLVVSSVLCHVPSVPVEPEHFTVKSLGESMIFSSFTSSSVDLGSLASEEDASSAASRVSSGSSSARVVSCASSETISLNLESSASTIAASIADFSAAASSAFLASASSNAFLRRLRRPRRLRTCNMGSSSDTLAGSGVTGLAVAVSSVVDLMSPSIVASATSTTSMTSAASTTSTGTSTGTSGGISSDSSVATSSVTGISATSSAGEASQAFFLRPFGFLAFFAALPSGFKIMASNSTTLSSFAIFWKEAST